MIVQTANFGDIEVDESNLYFFEEGLPGFEDSRRFILVSVEGNPSFNYLQSADQPDLVFVLADPFAFFSDYEFELSDAVLRELALDSQSDVSVRVILNARQGLKEATANLTAPLVFNTQKQFGKQIILGQSSYSTRHRLFPAAAGAAKGE
ncbi:flagellar assembly protein FliW [Cohnella rhizosphaerae]|uniref:Flagellar assembly factor FliW n=1 Tax=Cohnella rhizosphaerae TaxID=1457232 RepID=A0A9X4KW56_9BACL|nr:flagellar assembly protein FliW [Cohnella rhizosphaerae]MDG0811863.1 flagellar assembly protein FliW [Cohnella rhizosphaerae]